MAAKKSTTKASDDQAQNKDDELKQQELDQGGQAGSGSQEVGEPNQSAEKSPEPDSKPDPDPGSDPDQGLSQEPGLDDAADQDVFVLVDYSPLGLKCAAVATLSAAEARRLEKRGIVDTTEAAVARGKASQLSTGGREQVIEDDD